MLNSKGVMVRRRPSISGGLSSLAVASVNTYALACARNCSYARGAGSVSKTTAGLAYLGAGSLRAAAPHRIASHGLRCAIKNMSPKLDTPILAALCYLQHLKRIGHGGVPDHQQDRGRSCRGCTEAIDVGWCADRRRSEVSSKTVFICFRVADEPRWCPVLRNVHAVAAVIDERQRIR